MGQLDSLQRLGPYEITAQIGAGGMGEVFRARDTKLNRYVAIKVLPAALAEDRDRVARFRREAQLAAALNHPNIAAIHGLEESNGTVALVLELVEGEDLATRLARGPLPVDEAIAIARQLVDGLEAAHEKGIVHRDLKPANVKLTADGTVKILDFGLAKALTGEPGETTSGDAGLTHSPTMSANMTEAGVILGTAAYMSPEQARGKPLDKRSDIWSFGVVLHEMLTGERLFRGETLSDTLAAVLRQDVDLGTLPPETPSSVRRLLARCLERDPRRRLRDIGDARPDLEAVETTRVAIGTAPVRRGMPVPLAAAAMLATALVAGAAVWLLRRPPEPAKYPLARASFPFGQSLGLTIQRQLLAISPDGRIVATVVGSRATGSHLEVRRVDEMAATRIPGTEGAQSVFFSPDSRWIGFCTDRTIKKVPVESREVTVVAETTSSMMSGPLGASWADDGLIYLGSLEGIIAVPASGGGKARVVVAGTMHYHPYAVPGARFLLFTRGHGATIFSANGEVVLKELGSGKETVLTKGTSPRLLSTGLLLVARADGLFAAPLSLAERRLEREPVLVVPEVAIVGSAAQYDVSESGTLVHMPASAARFAPSLPQRVAQDGSVRPLSRTTRLYSDPRLSPDCKKLAFHLEDQENDVWVLDIARDSLTRLTFDTDEDETPVWSLDGQRIAYSGFARGGGARCVFRRRVDGSGGEEVLWSLPEHAHVTDWSPDGKLLVVDVMRSSKTDIVLLDLYAKPVSRPYLETPFHESSGRISPDGRWLAYRSDESGRDEIYLQPFPDPGRKIQISGGGGSQPVWSRDGRALYFRSGEDLMVARSAETGPSLDLRAPLALFKDRFARPQGVGHTTYDVFPDGSFVFMEPVGSPDSTAVNPNLIASFHWVEDLTARLPAGK